MKNIFLIILFLFCASLTILAQTPTVTPTPQPANEDDVVKISTTLIQVDVTVTDKKGKIVTDLKPEDFEIFENNQKQDITNFSFVSLSPETAAPTSSPTPKNSDGNAIPVPPKQLKPEQIRRTIALVVDDLSLSFESVAYVRQALKKFVETQVQDGDLVAIIRTGGGIGALQQFTSDKRLLYSAIEKVRWNSLGNGKIGAFEPIAPSPLEQRKAEGDPGVSDEQIQAERNMERSRNDFRGSIFATGTLGALNFIIKGMKDLPGRKSVMLMSDGFKIFTQDQSGFREGAFILDPLRKLTDLANRSSVVIYTMDARGLQTTGLTAEDNTSEISPDQIEQRMSDRRNELIDTQDGLVYLAKQTGGTSIINNNDLNGGIRKMLEDQKGYYLIGYSPDSETFDPQKRRFNKLNIKLKRPDLKVRYRSGFFGMTDEETERPVAKTPQQQISEAITSPFAANGIELSLNTLFGNDAKYGGFMRSFLHVSAKDMKFSDEPDGSHKATFDVMAMSFGDNGLIADQIAKNYTITLKKDGYEDFLKNGFVYNFVFPVKKPGAYQMRVALRDSRSGKVGSANQFIEVPNVKKGNLTVSGILLKNLSVKEFDDWQKGITSAETSSSTTSEADTSLRKFKHGTILRYGCEIYNVKPEITQSRALTTQIRVFRDGKTVFEGKPAPIAPQKDPQKIISNGALSLGSEMPAGDYVLQIVVSDISKGKPKTATQWVQFEVTD